MKGWRSLYIQARATIAQQAEGLVRLRAKLDLIHRDNFLLPHLSALDMAAALAKVRPVGGPPFDLVEGVRQVVHELLHLREWKARARERSLEVEKLRAEHDEATCAEMSAGLRARLEATIADTIEEYGSAFGDRGHQCTACQHYAPTPEAIRHVAGTRIGERACPYMLTARALGRSVLDDSEETPDPPPRLLGNNGHDCPNEVRCNDTCPDCGYEWPLPF